MVKSFRIKVPASSANIGPGFDVLGVGLELYLEIDVKIDPSVDTSEDLFQCKIKYEGDGAENVPLNSGKNLITNTALYILRCNNIKKFPNGTQIFVKNPIPLGRGLGSSGAAIVGGMLLGNEIGELGFSKLRLLDYCLLIERHPDNIAASMLGGFVGSYLNDLTSEQHSAKSVPLSSILPKYGETPESAFETRPPPEHIARYLKYNWCQKIKCLAIIPNFEVSTDKAREVLPSSYSKEDVVFNLQRLALLTTALCMEEPDEGLIYEAMKDKLHQPYRTTLIPGLSTVLEQVTPESYEGFCGICLSGAGPTILCLATSSFTEIADKVVSIFEEKGIKCTSKLLDLAHRGAFIEY